MAQRTYGSGSFWQSHGSVYFRIWVDGDRYQFRLGRVEDFPTQKSKEAAAREKLTALPTTAPRNQRTLTLADFIERTYLPFARETVRNSTYAEYIGMFQRQIKIEGVKPLRHYGTPEVQHILDSIGDPKMSNTTMKHLRAFLSGVFKFAKKRGYYSAENPVAACSLPPGLLPPRPTQAYTLAQVNAVLGQLEDDPETRAIVAVAAFAGLRRSEIQGLRWMDWDGDQLHVRQSVFNHVVNPPKSAASRNWVPVVPQLRAALDDYRAFRREQDEFGLMTPDARMFRFTLDHVGRKKIAAAFRRAGLKFAGYHGFRRGLASNLFETGCDDLTVMRVLRHASVQVTRSAYIKVRDNVLESAMARLSDAANQDANRLNGKRVEEASC